MQSIQSAARAQHLPQDPAKLESYLVGEPLTESRPLLERHSQAIIDNANVERPAGLETDFINRVKSERNAYVSTAATQAAKEAKAKQERASRDTLVKGIVARRKKIQYAADTLWPPRQPESLAGVQGFQAACHTAV